MITKVCQFHHAVILTLEFFVTTQYSNNVLLECILCNFSFISFISLERTLVHWHTAMTTHRCHAVEG